MKKIFLNFAVLIAIIVTGFSANAQTKRNVKQEEANKKLIMTFYQNFIGDKNVSAIDRFLDHNFITHNLKMLNGKEPLRTAFLKDFSNAPKIKIDFRNVGADGDLVFLHIRMTRPDGKVEAIVDIFKIKNNKIIEMWDMVQAVPETSANLHAMFSGTEVPYKNKRNLKQEETNKKLVSDFYQQLFGDKDASYIDKYLSKNYIQHNPNVADGSEALKTATKVWFEGAEKEKVDIQHVASYGDLVFLHVKNKTAEGKIEAVVDVFKIKNNKIVEHWDVIQISPENAVNPKPMF